MFSAGRGRCQKYGSDHGDTWLSMQVLQNKEYEKKVLACTPFGRVGQCEEVAGAIFQSDLLLNSLTVEEALNCCWACVSVSASVKTCVQKCVEGTVCCLTWYTFLRTHLDQQSRCQLSLCV